MGARRRVVAGSHGLLDRERAQLDFYRSPPDAVAWLPIALRRPLAKRVIDAGCGDGRLTVPLLERGHEVTGYDLVDRGYPARLVVRDWLKVPHREIRAAGDEIVMNPPYDHTDAFVRHGIDAGLTVHALLRHAWITAVGREWARRRLKLTLILGRVGMLPDGAVDLRKSPTTDYAWFSLVADGTGGSGPTIHVRDFVGQAELDL